MRIIPAGGKPLFRYILISVGGGIIFGALDGLINDNPYAQQLYSVYQSIARTSINIAAGIGIDLAYGFILSTIFLLLHSALPGESGIMKGLSYAVLIWFLRVVMSAASTWMMFTVPIQVINHSILTGLLEMLVLGVLYGLTLKP
jgi:hypothetical protein